MHLTESERKRIKDLYEASSASGSGSYETPMGFKSERPEMVGELPDEMGMDISDDEGTVIDVDELMGMLGLSEEEDNKRMRQLHKDNSVIVEQVLDIPEECYGCMLKAITNELSGEIEKMENLDRETFMQLLEEIIKEIYDVMSTGKLDLSKVKSILEKIPNIGMNNLFNIGSDMLECVSLCYADFVDS